MVTARHSLDELPAITGGRTAVHGLRPARSAASTVAGSAASAHRPGRAGSLARPAVGTATGAGDVYAGQVGDPQLRYWRALRRLTLTLLAGWGALVLGLPWYADLLNQWHVGGFPLGFWLSSQGAVGGFVLLIVAYVVVVERLDDGYLRERQASGARGPGDRAGV